MRSIQDQVKASVLTEPIRILALSPFDYCNLLYGLPNFLLEQLQRKMDSASRLIFEMLTSTPTS